MSVAELGTAQQVEARIWEALRHVEDPEIPVSVLGMGLIVSVAYVPAARRADLQITFAFDGLPGYRVHRGGHHARPSLPTRRSMLSRSRWCGTRCGPRTASAPTRA